MVEGVGGVEVGGGLRIAELDEVVQVDVDVDVVVTGGGEESEVAHGMYTVSYVVPHPLGQAVGQIVVLKMLGQPHSSVMV